MSPKNRDCLQHDWSSFRTDPVLDLGFYVGVKGFYEKSPVYHCQHHQGTELEIQLSRGGDEPLFYTEERNDEKSHLVAFFGRGDEVEVICFYFR